MAAAAPAVSFRAPVLPWAVSPEDEARFRRILGRVLAAVLLLCLVFPWIPIPKEDRAAPKELPPGYARLLLERPPAPPPPPPKVEKLPEAEVPRPVPKPDEARPDPTPAPVPQARRPEPGKAPGEALAAARRKAAGVGLLAMKDELADLRSAPAAVQLNTQIRQGPGVGSGTGVGVGAGADAGVPVRNLITSNATRGSGGINTAGYSRDTGGGGLAGRATTVVEGVAGGGGGGGPGGASGRGSGGPGGTMQRAVGGKASRSIEDVKIVLERNKGALYAIYNRALRDDPTLQGKVVLELKIAPSGEVLDCRFVSSELKAEDLQRKLLARIKLIDFGAKNVEMLVVTWPVDFLPS